MALVVKRNSSGLQTDFTKLGDGLARLVSHAALIREAVTLPAWYLYQNFDLLCVLVSVSTLLHISCVIEMDSLKPCLLV